MGRHTDAANAGRNAFRPNPFEFAEILYNWNPRADPDSDLDIPVSDSFSVVPMHVAANSNNRIDFNASEAWRYKKLTGYVASIDETTSETALPLIGWKLSRSSLTLPRPTRTTLFIRIRAATCGPKFDALPRIRFSPDLRRSGLVLS